ncbi:MAG TPA: S-methyl-5'-thioadenosine phosphorylase [Dissulfurispiraceae bacterium]|nr:S-methyl-5'-thioadenosine phosphorylase [Dissulfurispiraceae bacterium]
MRIGLIGGSGLYDIDGLEIKEEISISTPFGAPSSTYNLGDFDGVEMVFLARHGVPHRIPPHKVNYRANIWGFKSLGVEKIISIGAVGGINSVMKPGSVVILDQIIDMTMGARASTFYDEEKVVHVDFTHPYCAGARGIFIEAAGDVGLPVKKNGTYICVNGPRLETEKEIKFFSLIGADVVGMTAMPETALARELEMCCAGISVVTNYAAGIAGARLTTTEVVEGMRNSLDAIKALLRAAVQRIQVERSCDCKDALKDAEL